MARDRVPVSVKALPKSEVTVPVTRPATPVAVTMMRPLPSAMPTDWAPQANQLAAALAQVGGATKKAWSTGEPEEALANATPYGLSSGVVTRSMESAIRAVKGIRAGTVNVNEIPGYRLELSPFGGVKDSGLGIKEGVIEAMKYMTTVKTFSLPW